MIGSSSVDEPGDGSAAGSAKEESKRVEKESSRKGHTPSNAAAKATRPSDQRKKEEKRARRSTEREGSKDNGRSRSKRSSSSKTPADEMRRADEASTLPSSPTARSTTVKAAESGEKKKKERRRRSDESRSSAPSHTPTVRKSSKDGGRHRRESSSQSPSSEILVEAKAHVTAAVPTARAPSSAKGSKRQKRSGSSKEMVVDDDDDNDNEIEETPRIQQTIAVPCGGANAERTATPSSSGIAGKDARANAVVAPSYDFPTAAEAKNKRECEIGGTQPVTSMADSDAECNELQTEGTTIATKSKSLTLSEAEAEGSALDGGDCAGRQKSSAKERGDEDGRERLPRRSTRNGTDERPSRRHRSSTTEERPRRKRVSTNLSQAVGVKVIDEGDTKHLVLTAGEIAAVEGKSGSGSDRSKGGFNSSRRRKRGGSRCSPAQHHENDSQTQERSRHIRHNFATSVPTRGGDPVNPTPSPQLSEYLTDAFEQAVVSDETTARAASHPAPPVERLEAEKERHWKSTDDNEPDHPLMFAKRREAPAGKSPASPASPSNSGPCMAPSFSITTNASSNNQEPARGPSAPYNKRPSLHHATPLPDTSMSGTNPSGAQRSPRTSPSSSSSSPRLGRGLADRTARYVTHQASFHADISADYVDLNSPLGTVKGERGAGAEDPEVGTAASSLPAERSFQHDNDPAVSSTGQPPDMVWETSSQDDRQKVTRGAAPEATGARSERLASSSSLTSPTAIHAGSLAREVENTRLDSNHQGHSGRSATPSLSQDRLAGESMEDDGGPDRNMLHFRTDAPRHLVCGGRPELFFLRPNESLAVTRIEGTGRLLVTVREEAGAAAVVVVNRAILHDSAAHFGHAAVQADHRFPYVAGHRYEFEVEPAQGVELAVRGGGDRQATPLSQGSKVENPATGLHVVFSVTSAYTKGARLCHQDAARSSLPTFEAPLTSNSQQPKQPLSSPAATLSNASGAAESESSTSTQRDPERKPTPGHVRRSPSPSIAAALIAPCVSPPPAGTDNLAALPASAETSAPTPRAPAPAAVAKAPAETSSNQTAARVGGGTAEGFAQGGPPQNPASGDQVHVVERKDMERNTIRSEQGLRERWLPAHPTAGERSPRSFMTASPASYPYNAQQYRDIVPEGGTAMRGGDQPSVGCLKWNPAWEQQRLPRLPYIRRHVDHTLPRSGFEQHNPLGVAGSSTARESIAGAERFVRPPGYFAHEPQIQRKRQVEASRAADESHTVYHRPVREQTLYGPPPRGYHQGYTSDLNPSVATGREHHMPPDTRNAGGGPYWGERRDDREQPRSSDNRSRWREDDDEGWARKSEHHAYLRTGHVYQPATGRGNNMGEDPRRYRSAHGGGRVNNASSPSDSSRHGYKYGNGVPRSGKESAEMVGATGGRGGGAALSDPSRGRALAREGSVVGRGRREEQQGVELKGHADYHVGNGGYSDRLARDGQARRGVDNIASRESQRRKRTPQHPHGDDPHQPPAHRKLRHGNGAAHQISSTAERVPPRWIKF